MFLIEGLREGREKRDRASKEFNTKEGNKTAGPVRSQTPFPLLVVDHPLVELGLSLIWAFHDVQDPVQCGGGLIPP